VEAVIRLSQVPQPKNGGVQFGMLPAVQAPLHLLTNVARALLMQAAVFASVVLLGSHASASAALVRHAER
jgi:hypothetical protein